MYPQVSLVFRPLRSKLDLPPAGPTEALSHVPRPGEEVRSLGYADLSPPAFNLFQSTFSLTVVSKVLL
jgi:hypothetical protein